MQKLRTTVIGTILAVLTSVFGLAPIANAATINLNDFDGKSLDTMFNGSIWQDSVAGNIGYDFTNSAYDESTTEDKTIIYSLYLESCGRCKRFYEFVANDLLPDYAGQFVIKSYSINERESNRPLANQLLEHYGEQSNLYSTPTIIIGKTISKGEVDEARMQEIKDILENGGSSYDAIERINNGIATIDDSVQTELTSDDVTMSCETPVDSELKLVTTEIDRSDILREGYDYIAAHDISVYRYGTKQEIKNNQLTITLPVDQEYENYLVAYVKDGVIKETFDAQYADGKITFRTSHLSEYVIYGTNDPIASSSALSSTDASSNAAEQSELPENPNTADPIILYGVVLAISIATLSGSIFAYRKIGQK